jgi:hypothetical protein
MSEIKEPEDAVRVIMDALQFLQDVKVKTEWPIPVVWDRQGKLAKDYTLKEWYLKDQEELAESLDRELSVWNLDTKPGDVHFVRDGLCEQILEEECDRIHTIFSKLHQFGYTEEEIAGGIRRSNEKARERGCI